MPSLHCLLSYHKRWKSSCCSHQICTLAAKLYLGPSYIGQPLTYQWSHVSIELWCQNCDIQLTLHVGLTSQQGFQDSQFILMFTMHYALRFTALSNYVLLSACICTYTSGFHVGRDIGFLPPSQSSIPLVLSEFHYNEQNTSGCTNVCIRPLHTSTLTLFPIKKEMHIAVRV